MMFERILERIRRLADSIMTTKQLVVMLLFVSYIWDLTRKEYIDSRAKELECYRQKQAYPNHKGARDDHEYRYAGDFECPIGPMPRFFRIYRIFSTTFVIYTVIKYAILCTIYYEWLEIDKRYGCYLPGRLGLFVDEGFIYQLPWLTLIIFLYHLLWRILCHFYDPFEVECLYFLRYDRDEILDKQYGIIELNDPKLTPPDLAYKKYLCNKIFYHRLADGQGHVRYVIKRYRTVEHFERMEYYSAFWRLVIYWTCFNNAIVLIAGSYTCTRHDYFDLSYPTCRSLWDREGESNFEWSFSHKFRISYLLFDLLECLMFVVDTTLGITLPATVALILTHDLSLRFIGLRERLHKLNDRFKSSNLFDCNAWSEICLSTLTRPALKYLEDQQAESDSIFDETISAFEQTRSVDDYMRRYSTYTVFVWLVLTASYQAAYMLNLVPKSTLVTIFNAFVMVSFYSVLVVIYIIFSIPHRQARLLYNKLCIAMAVCPTLPKMKMSWLWLLEYYNNTTKNSLHIIGKSYALSNMNTLRCVSWFVTCTVIVFSLLK